MGAYSEQSAFFFFECGKQRFDIYSKTKGTIIETIKVTNIH